MAPLCVAASVAAVSCTQAHGAQAARPGGGAKPQRVAAWRRAAVGLVPGASTLMRRRQQLQQQQQHVAARGAVRAAVAAPRRWHQATLPADAAHAAAPQERLQQQDGRNSAKPQQPWQQEPRTQQAPTSGTVTSYEDPFFPPPGVEVPLEAQIERLEALLEHMRGAGSVEAKLGVLRSVHSVAAFLADSRNASVVEALAAMPAADQALLLCLPAMLQEHVLREPAWAAPAPASAVAPRLATLAAKLRRVELFYDSMGGLLGYQLKSLQLIVAGVQEKQSRARAAQSPPDAAEPHAADAHASTTTFHVPRGVDLAGEEGAQVGVSAAARGLMSLPLMAEIYPVGGAGDRLGLVDEATGESLPAAMLPYAGRTLLEALLRDLQAREYLHYQVVGRQVTTPVAIMTSDAKGNHERVSRLLADLQWAGRGPQAFRLFRQPMVPVVAVEDGRWLLSRPLNPMMKPGGHGAIWKLMLDEGVFEWLSSAQGRRAALVRQISNPMAGVDTTLLALAGTGFSRPGGGANAFGFMSCERAVGAAEGMNVVQERRRWLPEPASEKGGRWVYEYGVTNVEYTEFERLGLNDEAVSANSKTSVFPANTNVLYVGLPGAQRIVNEAVASGNGEQLMPGLIFNLNKKVSYTDPLGGPTREVTAGRMESTMQNLADFLTDRFDAPLDAKQRAKAQLSTFLVSNLRRKVTSSAKKRREPGSVRIAQTPDGSFYDLQRNAWQILQRCGLRSVPEPGSPEQYLTQGPGFIFLFHPALGPLWDVISQKVVGGAMAAGSELVLEAAEARLLELDLDGSLQVCAENVMGHMVAPEHEAAHLAAAAAAESTLTVSSLTRGEVQLPPWAPPSSAPTMHSLTDVLPQLAASGAPTPAAGTLRYSRQVGRVQMVNVRVRNAGIDWQAPDNVYWKHQVSRRETCRIVLLGQSEFEAYDVTLYGNHTFVVPDGHRLRVTAAPDGSLRTQLLQLRPVAPDSGLGDELSAAGGATGAATRRGGYQPSWEWQYGMDSFGAIRLSYLYNEPDVMTPGLVATLLGAVESRNKTVVDFSI